MGKSTGTGKDVEMNFYNSELFNTLAISNVRYVKQIIGPVKVRDSGCRL